MIASPSSVLEHLGELRAELERCEKRLAYYQESAKPQGIRVELALRRKLRDRIALRESVLPSSSR
jgi:hypothetical protein